MKSFAYGKIYNMMCQYFIEKSSARLERGRQNLSDLAKFENEILHRSEATVD